jgi:hypothetical protein
MGVPSPRSRIVENGKNDFRGRSAEIGGKPRWKTSLDEIK